MILVIKRQALHQLTLLYQTSNLIIKLLGDEFAIEQEDFTTLIQPTIIKDLKIRLMLDYLQNIILPMMTNSMRMLDLCKMIV